MDPLGKRSGRDALGFLLLALFSFILFGSSMIIGRYLTLHEAVLPQSAREMSAVNDWIVPTSAGRPWLERPPLPQWFTIASARLIGRFDEEWVVRLPAALCGVACVLMTALMASKWYGRGIGLLSGFVAATTLELTRYSWLAEADIYLCTIVTAAMTVFGINEFRRQSDREASGTLFGPRPAWMIGWFVLVGMTNLAKGLVFGTAMVLIPVGTYLLWNRSIPAIRRYVWFWGILLAATVGLAWPIAAWIRFPDVIELWKFDLLGRLSGTYTDINEPVWYYWVNLPVILAPWLPIALVGIACTMRPAFRQRFSVERFLWCWALMPLIVFTIPGGKHHHYMIHIVAPWAILTAHGLVQLRGWLVNWPRWIKTPIAGATMVGLPLVLIIGYFGPKLHGPDWFPLATVFAVPLLAGVFVAGIHRPNPFWSAAVLFLTVGGTYTFGLAYAARYYDECRDDTEFLMSVHHRLDTDDRPLVVNADLDSMDVFRILFYIGEHARPVHNLSFLRDRAIEANEILVVTRSKDRSALEQLGHVRLIDQAASTRREISPGDRFALFSLERRPDVLQTAGRVRVSPMQAMDREPGPFLGGKLF